MIDKMAIIDPSAKIADNVVIGPYSVIGPDVEIDKGTWIGPNVVIPCNTKIGMNNKIYQFASIGGDNQDLIYDDKPTYLEIGDNNVIHEFVTINRGSIKENCLTKIHNNNLIMAYAHIGHDCIIGSHTIFANGATLAGHVLVEDFATIGAYCAVHQFCHVGEYSFIARGAMVHKDVLPYILVSGNDPKAHGLNKVGLERNGFHKDSIKQLMKAYKLIFRSQDTLPQIEAQLTTIANNCEYTTKLCHAIQRAVRGFVR